MKLIQDKSIDLVLSFRPYMTKEYFRILKDTGLILLWEYSEKDISVSLVVKESSKKQYDYLLHKEYNGTFSKIFEYLVEELTQPDATILSDYIKNNGKGKFCINTNRNFIFSKGVMSLNDD